MYQINTAQSRPIRLKQHLIILTLLWTVVLSLSLAMAVRRGLQEIHDQAHYQAMIMGDKILDDIASISRSMEPAGAPLAEPASADDDTTAAMRNYLAALRSRTVFTHDSVLSRSHVRANLTAPAPTNPRNRPGAWERRGLEAFARGAGELATRITLNDLKTSHDGYRLILPIYLEKNCLNCHNVPGRRPGQLYGALTIDVPLRELQRIQQAALARTAAWHGALWLAGLGGLYLMARSLRTRIQERDNNRRLLQKERDFVAKVIDTGNIIVVVLDAQGRIVRFNPACERLTGYAAAEMVGRNFFDCGLILPEDRGWLESVFHDIMAGQVNPEEKIGENCWLMRNGEKRLLAWVNAVIAGDDGAPAYIVSKGIDITDRRRMEEEIRASAEKFRNLFENCSDAILIAEAQSGVITEANRAAERLLGFPRAQIVGLHQSRLHPPEDEALARQVFQEQLAGLSQLYIMPVQHAGGEKIPVEISASTFTLNGRTFIQGVFRDISERQRAEQERQRLEDKILHAQKLESLGVLAGGIAHDFNNLLMGVLGYADLALLELSPEAPARYNVQQIVTAALRAADLTRQMLAYSGKGKFVVEPLDLTRLVEEMTHLLQVSISKKAVLRFNVTRDLPPIEGDATQVRQVIMNLITNASDAIGEASGIITLHTGMMEIDRSYLESTYMDDDLPDGFYVYLEVSDTGCGMDAETRAKIFDPFFTTKFTGRGLGLAAVLGIVRGHHGGIKVYSEPGHGTTFKVFFPCKAQARLAAAGEAITEEAATWQGQGTVLVADDEETVRAVSKMTLESAGFKVLTAGDGREALELFRTAPDAITLVLLDMTMPHMNGEEAFRELRRLRPDVRIILSSGYNEQEATNRFVGKGLSGFIQKPYRSRDLLEKVTRLLQTGREAGV